MNLKIAATSNQINSTHLIAQFKIPKPKLPLINGNKSRRFQLFT